MHIYTRGWKGQSNYVKLLDLKHKTVSGDQWLIGVPFPFWGRHTRQALDRKRKTMKLLPGMTPFLPSWPLSRTLPPRACLRSPCWQVPGSRERWSTASSGSQNSTFGHKIHAAPSSALRCYIINSRLRLYCHSIPSTKLNNSWVLARENYLSQLDMSGVLNDFHVT